MGNVLAKISTDYDQDVSQFSIDSHWLYEEDCRLDASTYASGAFLALDAIEDCRYPKESIGSQCGTIWHPVQNQARSNFKRIYTKKEHGVPFVSSRDMFFLPLRPERFLSRRMLKLGDLMVPEGWILLSRSGTVGNILYVSRSLAKCAITDHAIRIEPTGIPAGYLYAFLSCSFGQLIIAKGTYGSTVDEIEPKHIASIPLPKPPDSIQRDIHNKIIQAYELRDEANGLVEEANERLHALLGVAPFSEDDIEYLGGADDPRAFWASSSDLSDRLDATHQVPLARSVLRKLQQGNFPLVQIAERVDQVYVAPRFARVYVESDFGTPLLQGSHVPSMRPNDLKYISNTRTDRMQRWIIRKGWVLVTCSGTIGRTAVVSGHQDGWAASQHVLRIMPRDKVSHPGFIAAFLSTPFGQHQIQSKVYGAVIPELTAEDMAIVYIPDVPFDQQADVGELVVRAYELRDKANELEDQAIAEMESVIMNKHEQPLKLVKKTEEPQSEADRFKAFVKKVVSVPKEEIDKRQAEYEAKKTEKKQTNK